MAATQSLKFAFLLLAGFVANSVANPATNQLANPAANPPSATLAPNYPINSLKRFPHHVVIEVVLKDNSISASVCGGTILGEQWIITSARCVQQAKRLQLNFQKLTLSDTSGSYTAVVNKDAIYSYPSVFEDLALVKIPFKLVFSSVLGKVALNTEDVSTLQDKMTVLPSFTAVNGNPAPRLAYTMLNIAPSSVCSVNNDDFDEFGQLCTNAWGNKAAIVCPANVGSGLIVDWPDSPKLVGIFSNSENCAEGKPTIYTNVSAYTSWIESVMAS